MSRVAAVRRGPGRPSPGQHDQRARLLDASAQLIAQHGVAGTTLSAVARRAKVTPALVHYYFGSKARLVDALFAERIEPLFARISAPLRDPAHGPLPLDALVRAIIEGVAAQPWLPPIIAREVLSEGGALRARFIEARRGMAAALIAAVEQAQRQGRLRAGLDPRLVVLSVMSAIVYPLIAAPLWRELLPRQPAPITFEQLAPHVADVLRHGLERAHA
jgi:AcrR family transcriptional regulator